MDNSDKPLGAPNLDTETPPPPPGDPTQPPAPGVKPKRKLNWKGFGLGVIAVIVIEVLAVSMLQSGDPEIPLQPPAEPTKAQTQPSPTKVSNTQSYLTMESWKVRMEISSNLANIKIGSMSGTMYSEANQAANVLAPELDAGWTCEGEAGIKATLGSISRRAADQQSDSYKPLASKQIGNFIYSYEASPTSSCTKDPRYQALVQEFSKAFNNLETYK